MAGVSQKHDWDKISREYIEAVSEDVRPSLESLAKKYGVSFGYIQQKCAKDKWVEQSKIFLRKVFEESQSQKITSLASEQTKFDADILKVARGLQSQIVLHLNEAVQTKAKLEPKDINTLTSSLSTIQRIGRTALDLDSWTPDKIINEALKLGYIITDPRDISKDGEDTPKEQVVGFSDILRENSDTASPIATEDQQ